MEKYNSIQCKKQTTVAVIMKDGFLMGIGTNGISVHVDECPRDVAGMKSGEGYHLCKEVCGQFGHAEAIACFNAGMIKCKGSTLYLIGHTYCCDNCLDTMKKYGILKVVIPESGKEIELNPS